MKVVIEFGREIEEAVQAHLEGGVSVREYIQGAVRFFNEARRHVREGNAVGYGDKSRFRHYNTVMEPDAYLHGEHIAQPAVEDDGGPF